MACESVTDESSKATKFSPVPNQAAGTFASQSLMSEHSASQSSVWAAEQIRAGITAGELVPGAKLAEASLCKALEISRNTLREAFATLDAERMVTRIPNRGVFVACPTAEDVRQLFRARLVLEPAALRLASSTNSGLKELENAIGRGQEALQNADAQALADANQDFHRGVVALSESTRLNELMGQLLAEMRLVFHDSSSDPGFHAAFLPGNAKIVELLRADQPEEAATAMAQYLMQAEAQILASLKG